eukprot:CAMPEP_0196600738 /NCGR_PEP_ID=MMETSP1081-20130531/95546_1 /TAXON_ID=36882 /ORGANISM="Pyramimonas amylifera, Strain CCMP720" /LENGTH=53 /DNA_ID=CAMNT_0041926591 /DNA_START=1254 /DNA_END=1415 /DNA_ORIENTATION=-
MLTTSSAESTGGAVNWKIRIKLGSRNLSWMMSFTASATPCGAVTKSAMMEHFI